MEWYQEMQHTLWEESFLGRQIANLVVCKKREVKFPFWPPKDRIQEINFHDMFQNLKIASYDFQQSRKVLFFSFNCLRR